MKQSLTIAAALVTGFLGGILGARVSGVRVQSGPEPVVRAQSFELVDEAGKAISFWGVDEGHNAVLAFGSRGRALGGGRPDNVPAGLKNPHNQRTAIGLLGDDGPMLKMSGADWKTRVRLLLTADDKPALLMEDETGPRVSLGIEQSDTPGPNDNDWTLVFLPERARIGMFTQKEKGQTYVRGVFLVNKDKVKYP